MEMQDQVALITGAASGIGQATAELLAHQGARVVLADSNRELGEAAVARIRRAGGRAHFVCTDVTDATSVQQTVRLTQELGPTAQIDLLVNAAGVLRHGYLPELSEADWDLSLDVNLRGTFLYCKAVLPLMLGRGRGVIVNISSSGARGCPGRYPAYVAAKTGVLGLTQAMANAFREKQQPVAIFALCPDKVDTPMGEQAFQDFRGYPPGESDRSRMLTPNQVAQIILRLMEPAWLIASGSIIDLKVI